MMVAMMHLVLLFGASLCVVMCIVMVVTTSVGMTAALFCVGGVAVFLLSTFGFRLGAHHDTKRSAMVMLPSLGCFVRHHGHIHAFPLSLSLSLCALCVNRDVVYVLVPPQIATMVLLCLREGEAFAAALVVSIMVVRPSCNSCGMW